MPADPANGAAALEAVSGAILAVAREVRVGPVLQRLVDAARTLVGARYAAVGVPDGAGGFARFLVSGMSDEQITALGPLPRTHGLLGATLTTSEPFRTADIRADPRFRWWPAAHPVMRSFLGVPIVATGDVVGAFYLTDKEGAAEFSPADQRLIELLAAHAAVALQHATLFERSREATLLEERERMARELHDAMAQALFSLNLTAETAAGLVRTDPEAAEAQIRVVQELARGVMGELRTLVHELQPVALERDGLAAALAQHVELLRRAHRLDVALAVDGERRLPPAVEREVLRVAQEALGNALRHARAERIEVALSLGPPGVGLRVADDGSGFDPAAPSLRARRLGLASMRERAAGLGGRLDIDSAPGRGTVVRLEVPRA